MPIRKGHVAPQHTLIESVIRKFDSQNRSYILANPNSVDCGIIYCSDNFCRLSGFSRAEVMQKASLCSFLHGPLTSLSAVTQIQQSLTAEEESHLEVLYYKKDGTAFFCSELIAPIRDENGDICLYILNFEDLSASAQDQVGLPEAPNHLKSRFDRARQSVRQSLRRKSGRSGHPPPPLATATVPTAPAATVPPTKVRERHHGHSHASTLPPIPSSETNELLGEIGSEEEDAIDGGQLEGVKGQSRPSNGAPAPPVDDQLSPTNHHPFQGTQTDRTIEEIKGDNEGRVPLLPLTSPLTLTSHSDVTTKTAPPTTLFECSEVSPRGWPSTATGPKGQPTSAPPTTTPAHQSVVKLKAASSLDRIGSGSISSASAVSTKVIQPLTTRSATTSNLSSANYLEWTLQRSLLVRPHTLDNIYDHKSQAKKYRGKKGLRNVSNSDSDLARHRISLIETKEVRSRDREKKSPSLSNLTHQEGLSRYKMSIQENGSGKFLQGVKVGEKVAQNYFCYLKQYILDNNTRTNGISCDNGNSYIVTSCPNHTYALQQPAQPLPPLICNASIPAMTNPPLSFDPTTNPTQRYIEIKNNCGEDVWLGHLDNPASPGPLTPGSSMVYLPANNGTYTYPIPDAGWEGRFWPKLGCNTTSGQCCTIGQSQDNCPEYWGCAPPADTLAEFMFPNVDQTANFSWYDVSVVDGFSIGMKIDTVQVVPPLQGITYDMSNCSSTSFNAPISSCPGYPNGQGPEINITSNGGSLVLRNGQQCMAPCKIANQPTYNLYIPGMGVSLDQAPARLYCCAVSAGVNVTECRTTGMAAQGIFGYVEDTKYVNAVHAASPTAYSYSYDDDRALFKCPGPAFSYKLTLCPAAA